MINKFSQYISLLSEGLIKTHDGKKAISYLVDSLRRLGFECQGKLENKIISFKIRKFNYIAPDRIDLLLDHMNMIMTNKFGWFPASMDMSLLNGMKRLKAYSEEEIKYRRSTLDSIEIQFDSKFDDYSIWSGKLYHLTIKEYLPKILKLGLNTKSKSKLSFHLDRIYVCKTPNECELLIPQMKLHYAEERDTNYFDIGNKKWKKNTEWVILETEVEKVKLYNDPRYEDGFYILNNITPSKIKVFKSEH